MYNFLDCSLDKKNENKEVAVNDFLAPNTAVEAIQYSMYDPNQNAHFNMLI